MPFGQKKLKEMFIWEKWREELEAYIKCLYKLIKNTNKFEFTESYVKMLQKVLKHTS